MSAKKVFISYSHDSEEHSERVLRLSDALRGHGIDAELDRYHVRPPKGWPHWCEDQLRPENAAFVLIICTEIYLKRVQDRVSADEGRGVFWEGAIIYDYLYDQKGNTRFIPVLFADGKTDFIPAPIRHHTHYCLEAFDLTDPGYQDLYRELTGQPLVTKPPLGEVISLGVALAAATTPLAGRPVRTDFPPISACMGGGLRRRAIIITFALCLSTLAILGWNLLPRYSVHPAPSSLFGNGRVGESLPQAAISIEQTSGITLRGDVAQKTADVYAGSVVVEFTNVLEKKAGVTELRVSWKKLDTPEGSLHSEGFAKGGIPRDHFVVRLATDGESRGTCLWTFIKPNAQRKSSEEMALQLPNGNSIRPRQWDLRLKRRETVRGEIVLKGDGMFEVTFSGILREDENQVDHPFRTVFKVFN